MADYTARNVLLKDSNGNYLIPYTEKADLSLGNLNSAGKAYVAIKGYNSSAAYSLNEVVMTVVSDSVLLYRSLVDNNTASLSDTTKWEEVELGGGSDIDNSTITLNSNDEIQTVGVIDNRSGSALKLWTGTRSQYDAIQSKDANTLYNITDDTGDLGTFANIALTNSPYTTNRILEIPQDIKLELNNGTLTLKAGSKVYVPNGFEADGTTPKFDVVTIASDAVNGNAHNGFHENFWLYPNGKIYAYSDSSSFSGPTQPTGFGTYAVWYDTANNVIKNTGDGGSTWNGGISLPVCRALGGASDTVTSIDQVFNGFGYIGSTVFVLPGIKCQSTYGRNIDGTYKNEVWSIQSVLTVTRTGNTANANCVFRKDPDGTEHFVTSSKYYIVNTTPTVNTSSSGAFVWCEGDGCWYHANGNGNFTNYSIQGYRHLNFAEYSVSNGKISSLRTKNIDSVANSNASNFSQAGRSYLSGLGMPSSRYIDLTLGASGSTYTAPANGYFMFYGTTTGNQGVDLINKSANTLGMICQQAEQNQAIRAFVPCKKGDLIVCSYSVANSLLFRFIYAEGEN